MTPKALLSGNLSLSSVNKQPIHSTSIVDYSNLLNLETYLDAISQEDHPLPTDNADFRMLFIRVRKAAGLMGFLSRP